jgi:hypothetical protein
VTTRTACDHEDCDESFVAFVSDRIGKGWKSIAVTLPDGRCYFEHLCPLHSGQKQKRVSRRRKPKETNNDTPGDLF